MNTQKWICLFLALLLSLPLASCGAEEETPETKEGAVFNPVVQMSKFVGTDKILMDCIINQKPWVSTIESQKKSLEAKLEEIISTVEKNYP